MSETKDDRERAERKVEPFLQEAEAKRFWTSLSEHKLTAQRCKVCGKYFRYPPQGSCPHCLSPDMNGFTSAVREVYSFVTYCRAWHPAYEDKVPYNLS